MAKYLRFGSDEREFFVEVDALEVADVGSQAAERSAGLRRWAQDQADEAVAVARAGFDQAVRHVVAANVPAFLAAADALAKPPAELEITFGLKGAGELGSLVVGKVSGECNYQVRMLWRPPPST